MQVGIIVVNNDSGPEVPGLAATLAAMPYPARVLHHPFQGKSAALNAGISSSSADYIAFLDDDEELAPDWFRRLEVVLEQEALDFVGGRTLPLRGEMPAWVPSGYTAVLGLADAGPDELAYGSSFPGLLMGGNAVISRAVLAKVGPYSADLGPRRDLRLFSCEDEDMYWRLLDAGAQGRYVPNLLAYHYIHPDRLRKSYYRKWCFWNGAAKGLLSRRRPAQFRQVAGVPRYLYGEALRGLWTWLRTTLTWGPARVRMSGELPGWHLVGRLYGRHVVGLRQRGQTPRERGQGIDRTVATL
jgi:glycosyltransferase involved in cell wall biosynthesis